MSLRKFAGPTLGLLLASLLAAAPAIAQSSEGRCEVHAYPADGAHSVGEDFDAIHKLDQDLADYYRVAGRDLAWLTVDRQVALLRQVGLGRLGGTPDTAVVFHNVPLSRHAATAAGPKDPLGDGCRIEVMVPQILLERGGLSRRSLRVFGVVRHYDHGQLVDSFSGFGSSSMSDFSLRTPAEADAATAVVERAYVGAVNQLLHNVESNAQSKPRS
ncbi:MAG: hypothetical protein ABIR87_04315 [Sphingomicrobium sp.]